MHATQTRPASTPTRSTPATQPSRRKNQTLLYVGKARLQSRDASVRRTRGRAGHATRHRGKRIGATRMAPRARRSGWEGRRRSRDSGRARNGRPARGNGEPGARPGETEARPAHPEGVHCGREAETAPCQHRRGGRNQPSQESEAPTHTTAGPTLGNTRLGGKRRARKATRHRGGADQWPGAASRGSRARGEGRGGRRGRGVRGAGGAARAAGFPSGSVERPTSQADGCAAPSAPNAAARAVRGGPGGTRLAPRAVVSERKKLRMQQKDVFKTVYWKARRRETEKRQQKKRAKNETANFSPNVSTSQSLNVSTCSRDSGRAEHSPRHTVAPPTHIGPAHAPRPRPRAHAPRPLLLSTARNAASRVQTTSACLFAPHLLVTAAPDSTISSKCRALKKTEESLCVSP